jgi:hypothetical protein
MTTDQETHNPGSPVRRLVGRIFKLFHNHAFRIIGHTENEKMEYRTIRLHMRCKCGKQKSERYNLAHPMVDEEANPPWRRSGYSWWMHSGLSLPNSGICESPSQPVAVAVAPTKQ